jgi:adenine-specific DNA-methyltransferase
MAEQEFINAGYTVVGGTDNNENKLLHFLKENYPNVIRDTEINIEELKAVLGLPFDEKINGYGLNFVGRNFARAKYAQKTEKELRLNTTLSKNIDTTEHIVLKGDNLDSLKILKNHYSGQIKCIYIDPPYNTKKDEFVYPDKFDKEEAEVLGLASLSESDFERMDFSFKTKKSHNGWLAFMYPRLLLARDLLSKDGVIFISIDENEQANLKLLCDNDIFGEENYVGTLVIQTATDNNKTQINAEHEYMLCYSRHKSLQDYWIGKNKAVDLIQDKYIELKEEYGENIHEIQSLLRQWIRDNKETLPKVTHYDNVDEKGVFHDGDIANTKFGGYIYEIFHPLTGKPCKVPEKGFRYPEDTLKKMIDEGDVLFGEDESTLIKPKKRIENAKDALRSIIYEDGRASSNYVDSLLKRGVFNNPKSHTILVRILGFITNKEDIILDFFAGSGTTGDAVIQLNADDGGNRKFILCQNDEEIKEGKPAHKFCIENNLPTVISSITIERLKRAGEKIAKDIEAENIRVGLFEEDKKQVPDIGFKVFDSVEAPKLKVDEKNQISIVENGTDALSRIYNMIFTVGLDEPSQVPEMVVENCIFKIGDHFYLTNSEKITNEDYSNVIKSGKVFIDGWTASLNGTLQNYKEDVKIVF